jgi:hypothetical protein
MNGNIGQSVNNILENFVGSAPSPWQGSSGRQKGLYSDAEPKMLHKLG